MTDKSITYYLLGLALVAWSVLGIPVYVLFTVALFGVFVLAFVLAFHLAGVAVIGDFLTRARERRSSTSREEPDTDEDSDDDLFI